MVLRPLGEQMSLARTSREEPKSKARSSLNLVEPHPPRSGGAGLARSAYQEDEEEKAFGEGIILPEFQVLGQAWNPEGSLNIKVIAKSEAALCPQGRRTVAFLINKRKCSIYICARFSIVSVR